MPGVLTAQLDLSAVRLISLQGTAVDEHLPLESSRSGSVFTDRFDPASGWYLPTIGLGGDPDAGFGFAATVAGVNASSGAPFDTARVTLTLAVSEPPDLAAVRAAAPSVTYRPVPMDGLSAVWLLVGVDASGADQTLSIPLTVSSTSDRSLSLEGSLVGASVVVAYDNLVVSGRSSLVVTSSYRVWRAWQPPPRWGGRRFPGPGWVGRGLPESAISRRVMQPLVSTGLVPVARTPDEVLTLQPALRHDLARATALQTVGLRRIPVDEDPGPDPFPLPDPPPVAEPTWTAVVDARTDTIPLGTRYRTDPYRSRFTVTAQSTTRPIIDISDLTSFSSTRSEFRELTSLGDVTRRYPSVRRLYLGQVSGSVVVIPQSYGIVRGSAGTAAACQAVVDDSADAASGCRFDLTFGLAPVVDPIELAQLAHDLSTVPEARATTLTLTLPSGIDPRTPSRFPVVAGATALVADGSAPQSVAMSLSIGDTGQVPAVCNVNTLLGQLVSPTTQLSGELVVRLDDVYPTPVTTSLVLSLTETAGTDDVSLTSTEGSSSLTVTNAGPLPLRVSAAAVVSATGPVVTALDEVLDGGASTVVAMPEGSVATLVRRDLSLPTPMARGEVFDYVDLDVTTVTSVQHPLSYNAAIDFGAAGVSQLDVVTTLTDYPAVVVSGLTLTPTHRVDSVHALVPLDVVVSGLAASVQLTVTAADGTTRSVTLAHDFVDSPIFVVTSDTLRA